MIGSKRLLRLSAEAENVDFPYPAFEYTTLNSWRAASDFSLDNSAYSVTDAPVPDNLYGNATSPRITLGSALGFVCPAAVTTVSGVNVIGGSIRLNYKPINNVDLATSTFQLQLFSTTNPASPGFNYHLCDAASFKTQCTGVGSTPGRWQSVSFPLSAFAANGKGATLTSIRFARILVFGSCTFDVGDIEFVPNPRFKAAVIFRMDDADSSAYTIMKPMLDAVGAVGMLMPGAISANIGIGTNLSIAQYQALLTAGWQSASQCYSTEDRSIVDAWTRAQRLAEYASARIFVKPYGHYRDTYDGSFYSNVGTTDMIAWPEMRDSFRTLCNFKNGAASGTPLSTSETFPFGDPKQILCLNLNSWGNAYDIYASHLLAALDQTRAAKGVLIIAMHNDLNDANHVSAVKSVIDYVTNQHPTEIEFTTLRRILAPYNGDTLVG